MTTEAHLVIPNTITPTTVLGPEDEYLRVIEEAFDVTITTRGESITITGDALECDRASVVFANIIDEAVHGETINRPVVDKAISLTRTAEYAPKEWREDIIHTYRGQAIRPKTPGQKAYVDAIRSNTITFGIGPAGTGKTYLAMAMALSALAHKEVGRIILTRPIVEAGENLGFLPGTLTEKVDPYIRPLYDALFAMMDGEKAKRLIDDNTIEIAPLAFMRGRTLDDSFVILDEAQNTTPEQMKMFLTRLGFGTKMVITGDITQTDLPKGTSGLQKVQPILSGINDIAFCTFTGKDVVRHSLVSTIIAAYARAEERKADGHSN